MPELLATLEAYRKRTYEDRKFNAALQGADLDEQSCDDKLEEIKRRAMIKSKGKEVTDPNDVVALKEFSGELGFGIGNGLGYDTA